jgi:hypothetical protein
LPNLAQRRKPIANQVFSLPSRNYRKSVQLRDGFPHSAFVISEPLIRLCLLGLRQSRQIPIGYRLLVAHLDDRVA